MNASYFLRLITTILSFLLFSCYITKEVKKLPSFDNCEGKVILAKGVQRDPIKNIGTPVETTNTFSTEDNEVAAYLECKNLSGEHKLKWEWYDSNGNLYLSTGDYLLTTAKEKYRKEVKAWHKLSIRGEKVANYPGDWQVKVYFDGELIASRGFKIEREPDLLDIVKSVPPIPSDKNKWALIVGIEKYTETIPALFAERDAILMKEFFKKLHGVPDSNIFTLINEKATLGTIKDYIENKLHFLTFKDTLYFYYSGHGGSERIGTDKPDEGIPYLILHDSNPYNLKGTGYPLEALYINLEMLEAKNIYVFLDACFSGSVTGRYAERKKELVEGVKGIEFPIIKDPILLSKKTVIFTSAQWNQISNSSLKERYGLFTKYIVKGIVDKESPIKEDGKITVEELYEYLKEKVSEDARRLYGLSRIQEPCIKPFPLGERKDLIIWGK